MKTAVSIPMPVDVSDYEVVPRQFFRNTARPDALFSSSLPADIEAAAFLSRLYGIIGWNPVMNYRAFGRLLKTQTGPMLLFSLQDAETVVKTENTRIKSADFPTKFGLPASENLRHNSTPQH